MAPPVATAPKPMRGFLKLVNIRDISSIVECVDEDDENKEVTWKERKNPNYMEIGNSCCCWKSSASVGNFGKKATFTEQGEY